VESGKLDPAKIEECGWKGFDHEMKEGMWDHQYDQNNYLIQAAPHATTELAVAIADEAGEYACFAGMWWIPENKRQTTAALHICRFCFFHTAYASFGLKHMYPLRLPSNKQLHTFPSVFPHYHPFFIYSL